MSKLVENMINEIADRVSDDLLKNNISSAPITRVQFLSGTWPNKEKDEGGLCREAFKSRIRESLKRAMRQLLPGGD